jgi:beta-lactamase superfamily II metal-dependent hydrolase
MAQLDESKYHVDENGYKICYAGYPTTKIFKNSTGTPWNEHLLFGDRIVITDTEIVDNRIKVLCRNSRGWISVKEIASESVLEVNFIDIGQGDGCHIITPDGNHLLIDAGEYDNMHRYLCWRFNLYNLKDHLPFSFKIVISHSDKDHYKGFGPIFDNDKIRISHIYHNGIVERPGESSPFGKVKNGYIISLVSDTEKMKEIITDPLKRKGTDSDYVATLFKSLKFNKEIEFSMLTSKDAYLPGFEENNKVNKKKFSVEVLGPLLENEVGVPALKSLKNPGKDKNGHSVLMKMIYGNARILLGGDINEEFGKLICEFYKPAEAEINRLQVDVAKACHHGSNHFHYGFVQSVNALATVISSGDDESYCHPRPDALGAFGKCGFGDKPLIFSTELARSNKEITRKKLMEMRLNFDDVEKLETELKQLLALSDKDQAKIDKVTDTLRETNKKINSYLTKYGMINLRTDGNKMIIAQKLERKSASGKWDVHEMKYNKNLKRFEQV